jgi:AcrR family transcriptional regulator
MSIDKKSAPRIRRSPEASRDNILAAAETLLVERGPHHLKLADVAAAAHVANATVLHHFGSIDGVQAALMDRMIAQLVDILLQIDAPEGDLLAVERAGVQVLFDAFESRGAARLAAWLELSGEARRLTGVGPAFRAVLEEHVGRTDGLSTAEAEDHMLVAVILALGVGLFGPTLGALMGKSPAHARTLAMKLLHEQTQQALDRNARR